MIYASRTLVCVVFLITLLVATSALADDASSTPDIVINTSTDSTSSLQAVSATGDTASSTDQTIDPSTATSTSGTASSTSPEATSTDSTSSPQASSTPLSIEGHVNVPATCTATDTDAVAHTYEAASSTSYLAICAVEAALEHGIISDIGLSNEFPTFGLFVTSINGVAADPNSEYWALLQNGSLAPLGLTSLPITTGDTIELQLHDFSDNNLGDDITLHSDSLVGTSTATSTSSGQASSTPLSIEGNVDVPVTCTATDTDAVAHEYAAASSTSYLGICALEAALDGGVISEVGLSNQYPSFGLFVTEINGVTADPDSQYWALYQNGSFASLGITSLPVVASDTIQFQLHDFSDNDLGDRLTLHIGSLLATSTDSTSSPQTATTTSPTATTTIPQSHGGGGSSSSSQLNIRSVLSFLASKQKADGSFDSGNLMLTDWTALAFAAADPGQAKTMLKNFLLTAAPPLVSTTDYERHAMALEALGINPYNGTPTDYIAPIVASFDGTQIGSVGLVNDDIFAIVPLLHAGYTDHDAIIQKTVGFIVSQQKNGSWGDTDMTAAAIQALEKVESLPGVAAAITQAKIYLHTQQDESGGFIGASGVNTSSTSWALQALAALGESPSGWSPAGETPAEYLAAMQQSDGGVDPITTSDSLRIWSTSYAVPAALNKTWDSLLSSFPKPAVLGNVLGAATTTLAVATTTATTTSVVATSTPVTATSTIPLVPVTVPMATVVPTPPQETHAAAQQPHNASVPKPTATSADILAPAPAAQTRPTAVAASDGNIFGWVWGAIARFFSRLFGML